MMRRRFGRRRWGVGGGGNGGDDGSGRSLDAAQELARVLRLGLVPADALEPVDGDEIPATLAVVGTGTSRDGEALVVGVAPSGGDAWLAALAVATRIEGFSGSVIAIAPSWPVAARRRLGLLRATPFGVHARLEAGEGAVEPEPLEAPLAAASVVLPEDALARALFERATLALAGLAAKHGGATRTAAGAHEMVLLGRVAALLRADEGGVLLELREPRRELIRIASDGVADAFDRVEGSLRKFLGDRRMREGEAGIRWTLASALPAGLALRRTVHWPVGDALDLAGIDAQGRGVAAAVRGDFGLAALGPVLDAWAALQPRWPALFPDAADVTPSLCIAAEQLAPAAARVLALLEADLRWMEASRRGREPSFLPRALPSAPESARTEARTWTPPAPRAEPAIAPAPLAAPVVRSDAAPIAPIAPTTAPAPAPEEGGGRRRFEEFSLFDLGEGATEESVGTDGRRRRRRRRGRGRGGREGAPVVAAEGGADDADAEGDEEEEPTAAPAEEPQATQQQPERGARRGRGRRGRGRDRDRDREGDRDRERPREAAPAAAAPTPDDDAADDGDEEGLELDEAIAELAEVPEIEVVETPYEEDEDEEGAESEEQSLLRREREQRRRARLAKVDPVPDVRPPPRPPRRRAAILAHADRESVAAAVLLARDLRLIEGIWIYPQEELMSFFRSIATDLREDTPIVVVGFTARPVRETLQTASLYRERLTWYDHHEWPPEDLEAMRQAIGADNVHVDSAAGSALAVVLSVCTRRSRFSDKLVDLLIGRFSAHDYERWGRLWWSRLAQLAARHGERRTELEALLVGRPSELARQAARVSAPPVPDELEWIAARDFRIVHFGGHSLVRVPLPPEQDIHLAARIARERYRAPLSLAWTEGNDRFVLASDETPTRRILDVGAMVEHLGAKFGWVDALPDPDHVARFRIRDAATHPERIDEVVAEIAMGRSILEG
jgi:hypothetical protein